MKIAFFEIEGWEEPLVKNAFPGAEIFFSRDKIAAFNLPAEKDFEIISIFVDSRLDKAALDSFPNLKCLATRSTGYDHIDIEECRKRGISVLYVPGYGDNTVAEFTFGLLLNLTRKIYQSINQLKETCSFSLEGLRGTDLKGKTLGIVGAGRIGKESAKIGRGFGMLVLGYDPFLDQKLAAEIGLKYVTLDELLEKSDVITLHCPYNKDTHHLINKSNIAKIKRGAYLVNTARGGIVETEAVIQALKDEILAGYAADVLEEEGETKDELNFLSAGHPKEDELKTMLRNHILMKMPNVLLTPHNAFNSAEALQRILNTTLENIRSYIAGQPVNVVNK